MKKRFAFLGALIATFIISACNKTELQHDTTYTWGKHYWTEVWPADKVAASADSASVRYVYLLNDGKSFEGTSTTITWRNLNKIIENVTPKNRHKIRGAGILNEISTGTEQNYQDSIKLANMGFKFGRVYRIK